MEQSRVIDYLGQKTPPVSEGALMQALTSEYEDFLKPLHLYVAHYNAIPSETIMYDMDAVGGAKWFAKHYYSDIVNEYRKNFQFARKDSLEVFYCLRGEIMVYFDIIDNEVTFYYQRANAEKVGYLIKKLKRFQREPVSLPEMYIMLYENGRLETEKVPIHLLNLDIATHYNDDFIKIDQIIQEKLNGHKERGLVLLHGAPGTGKTSYLRHLIASINKRVIFMPPSIAMEIGEPSLMTFLIKNSNSIFVIEDAESLVKSREGRLFSPVASILNICDGLISDFLNIQVICTFNTDISKIDTALLRKGRLIARYEFKELAVDKAQALSDSLGFNRRISRPTCLSDIYNQDEKDFEQLQRVCIGFKPSQTA